MIIKYILLVTICYQMPNITEKCIQQVKNPVSDQQGCIAIANHSGKAFKQRVEALSGSVTSYEAFCYAIDNQGYSVDHSFKISYNIL